MKNILSFLLVAACLQAGAQQVHSISSISDTDATWMLEHHNKARAEVGVQPLSWNAILAAEAQEWANELAKKNNCQLVHSSMQGKDGRRYGENLFWGSSARIHTTRDASLLWYGEKPLYNYERVSYDNYFATGHYTQMVWKTTREMGAGVAFCASGGIVVVANYYPAGNIVSQYPY